MSIDLSEILKCSLVLFAVIDIIGSIPIIIKVRQSAGDVLPLRASLVALGIMVVFLFIGETILGIFGVTIPAFAVAGSFILLFLALEMILGVQIFKEEDTGDKQKGGAKVQSVVPLAFPVIAGAGTITTILSLRAEFQAANILIAIFINIILVYVVIRAVTRIESLLGTVGIIVLKKAFGVILLAIAVKLFSSNISSLFEPTI